jgi:8-oxo-dGTP pyrophosphatase MutT (NUDIX family)
MYGTVNLLPLAPRLISFDFNSLLLLKYLMISKIREKLALYKPQDIYCVRSKWAGVVIPIFETSDDLFIILTKRAHTVSNHKGEVSFPGGMYEEGDRSRMVTAVRECCEEIGMKKTDIDILGRIDDIYTMTGFCVRPYVGVIPYPYQFTTSPQEVAYIIQLPFQFLRNVQPGLEEARRGGHTEKVPSFYYEGDRIWGATCRMLLRLRRIVNGTI